jgi:hypothetical protein
MSSSVFVAFRAVRQKSVTVDEFAAVPSGMAILKTNRFIYPIGTPPLSQVLAALPVLKETQGIGDDPELTPPTSWSLGTVFAYLKLSGHGKRSYHEVFMRARWVSLSFLFLTLLFTWLLGKSLYGDQAALVGLVFAAFCPNLLAHGGLSTPDIFLSASIVAFLFAFDRLLTAPSVARSLWVGGALGLAVLFKLTGILLVVFFAGMWLAGSRQIPFLADGETAKISKRRSGWLMMWSLLVCWIVLHAGYNFQFFRGYEESGFSVAFFKKWDSSVWGCIMRLFPYEFWKSIDEQAVDGSYPSFFLGQVRQTGSYFYYAVGFLLKTPLATLFMMMAAGAWGPKIRKREIPLVLLVISFFIFFSLETGKNIGIRYLLFIFPLLGVWIGRILHDAGALRYNRLRYGLCLAAIFCLLVSTGRAFPDFIPYFNEAAGGPDKGQHYLLDSNLDWGQDLITLRKFMKRRKIETVELAHFGPVPPEVYGINYRDLTAAPTTEYVAISANYMGGIEYSMNGKAGLQMAPEFFASFKRFKPEAILGHSLYVFRRPSSLPRSEQAR